MVGPIVALPLPGLVTNIVSEDGSVVVTNPKGNITNIQARPLVADAINQTGHRTIGTTYTNGDHIRSIAVCVKLQANATTSTATYHTHTGGTVIDAQFGLVGTGSTGTGQNGSFYVDAGADYSVTTVLGTGGGGGTSSVLSWVETDHS